MASSYLEKQLGSLKAKNHYKATVTECLQESLKKIKSQAVEKILNRNTSPRRRLKKIATIQNIKTPPKFSQKDYMASFKEKAQENRNFALKLYKEQSKRKNRQEEREEEIRKKLLDEIEEQEREKELLKMKKDQLKQDQVYMMMEKTKARQQENNYLKEIGEREYRKAVSATPLYKKIETDFIQNIMIPELEKRKSELRKKRELFKPITKDQIKEHAKNVEMILSMISERKKQSQFSEETRSYSKSKILKQVLAKDKEKERSELEKKFMKKHLKEKKKQYSELVKEVFPPTLDLFKKKEMELIKARMNHPVTVKCKTPNSDDDGMVMNKSVSFNPRKFKKNNMIPDKTPKRLPVIKDYILEMREERKRSLSNRNIKIDWDSDFVQDLSVDENRRKLQRRAEILDREARKAELKIDYTNPTNTKNLKVSEKANELIVDSIRAKLAILEHN
ncbi:hypothetical protein SteCoe_8908 [Stentor coeruleus]|uniref:Uncharacterized protein n=1 Tax=Stentor coeruleus TaxID=5963 RepID=A0A1R2CJ18_9CILI|nr:hypothetical protein SteCoe_8908 [Stentor coeruleus]